MAASFLGLDIGTSSVKALLIDENQAVLAESTAPLSVSRPRPLWSEQDPDDWWIATQETVAAVRTAAPLGWQALAGIGLSGQMHGATLLGAHGNVLRPAILWNDGRSAAECAELERRVPDLRARTGNIAMAGFTAPKLLWVAEHEPEVFAATSSVLLPKDFVRLQLTGARISDMSDASGTLWLDVANRRWDETMLAATGLSRAHMPDLVEGSEVSARLSPDVAAAWGVGQMPVAGGAGDNAASAVGIGAVRAGQGFLSLGTSGVLFAVTDKFVAKPERTLHAFCHALPGRWHGMSVILSAAASLAWIAGVVGRGADIAALLADVGTWADTPGNPENAPIFLPYLSGERTPHNDPQASGMFAGLRSEHGAESMTYAVLEGVAFALADGLAVMREAGAGLQTAMVVGGGARSPLWGRLLASVLGIPLQVPRGAELGAAFGAARLGMLAATGAGISTICTTPEIRETFAPDAIVAGVEMPRLERFRRLYQVEHSTRIR